MRTITLSILVLLYGMLNAQPISASQDEILAISTTNLIITGIGSGATAFIELYVAKDIVDLNKFGLETVPYHDVATKEKFTFPPLAAKAGTYLYITTDSRSFRNWFKFSPDYLVFSIDITGKDAVVLYEQGAVVDVFGEVGNGNTATSWQYTDGYANRKPGTLNSPDFSPEDWLFSAGAWEGATDNLTAVLPFQSGTFAGSSQKNHFIFQVITQEMTTVRNTFKLPSSSFEDQCCGTVRGRMRNGL